MIGSFSNVEIAMMGEEKQRTWGCQRDKKLTKKTNNKTIKKWGIYQEEKSLQWQHNPETMNFRGISIIEGDGNTVDTIG